MAYFPMFVDIKQKNCLIVGGGVVAYRKACMMLDFEANVKLIAPDIVKDFENVPNVIIEKREFEDSDIFDMDIVIASTDNVELNSKIADQCKSRNIPVNVVNNPEAGTFICPSYEKTGSVVAAFSSGGKNPAITQYLKKMIKPFMTKELAEMVDYLGNIRTRVKNEIADKSKRKQVYEALIIFCQQERRLPTEEDFSDIITRSRIDE